MENFLKAQPFAHRGLHDHEKPENSLRAFRAAVEHGYGIETDIHLLKDGNLVVFHDDSLKRMTGDSRMVRDCTYEQLRALSLGGTGEHIPLFSEFLETVQGKVPLLIEIKNMKGVKGKEIARALSNALQGYGGKYAVQSFQPLYVRAYKKLHPEIPCGVLGAAVSDGLTKFQARVIKNLSLNFYVKPDFVSYHLQDLPRKKVTRFKGVRLAWTVRSFEEATRARQYTDNIIFENFLPEIK